MKCTEDYSILSHNSRVGELLEKKELEKKLQGYIPKGYRSRVPITQDKPGNSSHLIWPHIKHQLLSTHYASTYPSITRYPLAVSRVSRVRAFLTTFGVAILVCKQRNGFLYVYKYIRIGIINGVSDVVMDFDWGAHGIKNPNNPILWHPYRFTHYLTTSLTPSSKHVPSFVIQAVVTLENEDGYTFINR